MLARLVLWSIWLWLVAVVEARLTTVVEAALVGF
jgi:hypothetical protein